MSDGPTPDKADDAAGGRPPLLPHPSSIQPTHIASHLPPLKSLQHGRRRSTKSRSPSRRYQAKDDAPSTTSFRAPPLYRTKQDGRLPNTNTLQTFLSTTEVTHFGHASDMLHGDNDAAHNTQKDAHQQRDPSHAWTVRKTPIFSGLVAPLSIVLEIPGLTTPWYAKINSNGIVVRFIDNPHIVTVGLSISLAAAVVTNLALILRFLEVLRPRASIIMAIAASLLHDLINVVALATFGGIYGPKHDGLSLSASYWMVAAATITSTLVTISLVFDHATTKDFRHAGSGLTQLQKGLVLAGMALLLYLSLGSLIFVFVIKLDFIAALYFSTATVLTVGFGDIVPGTALGKVLVIIYAPIGIVLVAMVVSSARNSMLETFQATLMARTKERRRRLAERRAAQREHKRQDRALRRKMPRTFTFGPSNSSGIHGEAINTDSSEFAEALARMEKEAASHPPEHDNNATAPPSDVTTAAESSSGANGDASSISKSAPSNAKASSNGIPPDPFAKADASLPYATAGDCDMQERISALQHELLVAKQRSEEDFRLYEEHARREAKVAARMKLSLAASTTLAFWLLGAVAFKFSENWNYGDSLWFCFIAMITIGYGDFHPYTQLGRAIFVIWGLMGVAVLTILLAVIQDAFGSIFSRMLTKSTSRLFNRGERRLAKRRRKLQQQREKQREEKLHKDVDAKGNNRDGDPEATADGGDGTGSRRHSQGKSKDGGASALRSASLDRSGRKKSTEKAANSKSTEVDTPDVEAAPKISIPSFLVEATDSTGEDVFLTTRVSFPAQAAARVEDTLVSTPQKVALAALQAFQHSVLFLHLNEAIISKAMTDIPALRHYYNSRQRTAATPLDELSNEDREDGMGMDPEVALQQLHASLQQTANPQYEKVAKLVVANLEFEHYLRILLEEFQGLKERVEGFKQKQLQRSLSVSEGENKAMTTRPHEGSEEV